MKTTLIFLALCAAILVCGCGGTSTKPDDLPKLFSCEIAVKQDGQPLAGALVTLRNPSCRFVVAGTTDAEGVAKIMTQALFDGAPEGDFIVLVEKMEDDSSLLPARPGDQNLTAEWEYNIRSMDMVEQYNTVASNFAQMETSPLTITVSGKTTAEFDVGASVRTVTGSVNATDLAGIPPEPEQIVEEMPLAQ